MTMIEKLLGYLNRVFDKDPKSYAALTVSRPGGFSWSLATGVMTLAYDDRSETIDLSAITVGGLATVVAALPGFTASVVDPARAGLNAQVLIDGDGSTVGAETFSGFTSLLWAYYAAIGKELRLLRDQVPQAILQMNPNTGSGIWLDEVGSYYGVPRLSGETDASYGPRIIAETLRPRANNNALSLAIQFYTGQVTEVEDAVAWGDVLPRHDGQIDYDGSQQYDADVVPIYGLFDVFYGYDLENGGDITDFQATLRSLINRLRAAGTHLRTLVLRSSEIGDVAGIGVDEFLLSIGISLEDTAALPADDLSSLDGVVSLSDVSALPDDEGQISYQVETRYDGVTTYNGLRIYSELAIVTETLEGANRVIVPA